MAEFQHRLPIMNVTEALLESWDRQSRIVNALASLVDDSNQNFKPSEDGGDLLWQLAHIHNVRRFWLSQAAPEAAIDLPDTFTDGWQTPITDLDAIRAALEQSAVAVRKTVESSIQTGAVMKGYDHPVMFLQHMVWHEGWHVGLLMLGLRLGGQEPTEEWEEANIWNEWRTEG